MNRWKVTKITSYVPPFRKLYTKNIYVLYDHSTVTEL